MCVCQWWMCVFQHQASGPRYDPRLRRCCTADSVRLIRRQVYHSTCHYTLKFNMYFSFQRIFHTEIENSIYLSVVTQHALYQNQKKFDLIADWEYKSVWNRFRRVFIVGCRFRCNIAYIQYVTIVELYSQHVRDYALFGIRRAFYFCVI